MDANNAFASKFFFGKKKKQKIRHEYITLT